MIDALFDGLIGFVMIMVGYTSTRAWMIVVGILLWLKVWAQFFAWLAS